MDLPVGASPAQRSNAGGANASTSGHGPAGRPHRRRVPVRIASAGCLRRRSRHDAVRAAQLRLRVPACAMPGDPARKFQAPPSRRSVTSPSQRRVAHLGRQRRAGRRLVLRSPSGTACVPASRSRRSGDTCTASIGGTTRARQAQRHIVQVELERAGPAVRPVRLLTTTRSGAASGQRRATLCRQAVLQAGEPQVVGLHFDPRVEALRVRRASPSGAPKIRLACRAIAATARALGEHELAVAPQLMIEIVELQRRTPGFRSREMTVASSITRRPAGSRSRSNGGLSAGRSRWPEQPDAAIGEAHDRDARRDEAHAARQRTVRCGRNSRRRARRCPRASRTAPASRPRSSTRTSRSTSSGPYQRSRASRLRVLDAHVRLAFDPRPQACARCCGR